MSGIINIKAARSSVRTRLCIEDVYINHLDVLLEFGNILEITVHPDGETAYVFKDPYQIPIFNQFYASKIKGLKDPYLKQLMIRLLYLNPRPDELAKKKLVEFTLATFVKQEEVDSGVHPLKSSLKPVISFEELSKYVDLLVFADLPVSEVPMAGQHIMFRRQTVLDGNDRKRIRAQVRRDLFSLRVNQAIEFLVMDLVEEDSEYLLPVKITNARILGRGAKWDFKMDSLKPLSAKSIVRHTKEDTKNLIEDYNLGAILNTENARNKFLEYLSLESDLGEELSINQIVRNMNVSKSTAVEFRGIKKWYRERKDKKQ